MGGALMVVDGCRVCGKGWRGVSRVVEGGRLCPEGSWGFVEGVIRGCRGLFVTNCYRVLGPLSFSTVKTVRHRVENGNGPKTR